MDQSIHHISQRALSNEKQKKLKYQNGFSNACKLHVRICQTDLASEVD